MNLYALQHSAFLQSLGWAIANSLWQAAILWTVYYIVNASYKNATSKFRNLLGTMLLFSIFAWFTQTFLHRFFLIQDHLILKTTVPANVYSYVPQANPAWKIILKDVVNNLPYLSIAYLLLLVIFLIRLINSYRNINFIKSNGLQKPPAEWRLFTDKVSMHIGINKKIKLWFSEYVDVPATLGFLKPVILIPLASVNQLSPDQLEAIILHELSHIKRNDYFINLFISIIETILFFNPFVVLLSKVIKSERENCCDDFVIQYKYDPHSYASALLALEQSRSTNLRLAIAATSGKKQLLYRVKRIMESKNSNKNLNYGQKLLALILVTGIITSVAWLSPQKKENISEANEKSGHVTSKPFTQIKMAKGLSLNETSAKKLIIKNKKSHQLLNTNNLLNQGNKKGTEEEEKESFFTYDDNKTGPDKTNDFVKLFSQDPEPVSLPPTPPAIFHNATTTRQALKNAQLSQEFSKKFDLKKFQLAFEKGKFSFAFDWGKWQDDITRRFNRIKLNDMMEASQKFTGEEVQKLVENEMRILKTKALSIKGPRNIIRVNSAVEKKINKNLYKLVDSILALSAVVDKGDQKYFRKMPEADVYKYEAPHPGNNNSTGVHQQSRKVIDEKLIDTKTTFQHLKNSNEHNYNFEYRAGAIILNGEKLKLPEDVEKRPLLKSKKTVTINSEGNNIIRIQIED